MNTKSLDLFSNPVDYGVFGLVLFIIFVILSIILMREITLWYFRINKNTETLEKISASLEKIAIANDFLARDIDFKNHNKKTSDKVNNVVVDNAQNEIKEENK